MIMLLTLVSVQPIFPPVADVHTTFTEKKTFENASHYFRTACFVFIDCVIRVLARQLLPSSLTADEARGLQDFFLLLFLTPQVGEGVDDDAKNKVEDDDDDHEEEQQVVDHSGCKQRFLGGGGGLRNAVCETHDSGGQNGGCQACVKHASLDC